VDGEPFQIRRSAIEDITCLSERSIKRALTWLGDKKLIDRNFVKGEQFPAETAFLVPPQLAVRGGAKIAENRRQGE